MKRLLAFLMIFALALPLFSCSTEKPDFALTERVEWSHDCANMTLMLPEGWRFAEADEEGLIGVSLIPPTDFGGDPPMLGIYCAPEDIGLCGTVWRTDDLTLSNGMKMTGYFDRFDQSVGYTAVLPDTAGCYLLKMNVSEDFYNAYIDTILAILGGGSYGDGFIGKSEALARAEAQRSEKNDSNTVGYASFDISTGLWTVTYRNDYNGNIEEEIVIDGRIEA